MKILHTDHDDLLRSLALYWLFKNANTLDAYALAERMKLDDEHELKGWLECGCKVHWAWLISEYYQAPLNGNDDEWYRAVASSSCVALRLHKGAEDMGITPQYLLMYLRSAEGQEQIRSLQVGAAMPHISIQTLMNAVRIPVPSAEECADVIRDYEKLCLIEDQIKGLSYDMTSIAESRWIARLD